MTEVNDQQGTGPELGLFPLGKTLLFAGVVYREMEAGPGAGGAAMQYLTPGSLPVLGHHPKSPRDYHRPW